MKGWSDGCNHPVRTRCLRVQGPCGPRTIRRQLAAPGASVRSLPPSCAPAQGAARASCPWNFNRAKESPEQDPPGPAPRPRTSGRQQNLELQRSPGTVGTAGSKLGMLGAGRGPRAREAEPPGGAQDTSRGAQLASQPLSSRPQLGWGLGAFFVFKAQWESWEFIIRERRSSSSPSRCVTWGITDAVMNGTTDKSSFLKEHRA
ncbi:uncharacterized protein LOC125964647 isoform X2 [Orcinus orca]|uniref:uncharacterized protein LOC125964647 isoform X2 n=1 Tax=Orcinus orca TaxID=9733 RepID=UPI002112D9C8|nr:uncharacterized protein LOC125964647 isoform X2 [Orcinus orca]